MRVRPTSVDVRDGADSPCTLAVQECSDDSLSALLRGPYTSPSCRCPPLGSSSSASSISCIPSPNAPLSPCPVSADASAAFVSGLPDRCLLWPRISGVRTPCGTPPSAPVRAFPGDGWVRDCACRVSSTVLAGRPWLPTDIDRLGVRPSERRDELAAEWADPLDPRRREPLADAVAVALRAGGQVRGLEREEDGTDDEAMEDE